MNERRRERAVVVASIRAKDAAGSMEEMIELLQTAGVEVVGQIMQRRQDVHRRTYIGAGKVEELRLLVVELDPDIVVVDDELNPSQQRALEDALERRVLDRTAVILDIFALHAHTAEGKLQVELAQLEYNIARMRGMWQHLERLGGGIGTRGPGESQLETDRRVARTRVAALKRRLTELGGRRSTMRAQRQQSITPKVALAGYTNAGKSTLLNTLTGSDVSVRDRLFETLDPTTRSFEENGRRYLITDTVGFIERLPHQLVSAFASTLEETLLAELILIVTDGSLPPERREQHIAAVEEVLTNIGAHDIPRLHVFNKIDRIDEPELEAIRQAYPDAILISAREHTHLDTLRERIATIFASRFTIVDLLVPYADAGILSELYDAGAPVARRDDVDGIHARAHVPHRLMGRIERYRVEVDPVGENAPVAAATAEDV